MWQYQKTDELYHYGVPGMKWGHRKSSYGSLGANLSARLRNRQMKTAKQGMKFEQQKLKRRQSAYKELQDIKKHAESKDGSKLAKSRVITAIRNHQMKSLKNKINNNKKMYKEYKETYDFDSKMEKNARQKADNIARTKKAMQKAKMAKKEATKEYNQAYDQYRKGPLIGFTKNQRTRNSKNWLEVEKTAKQVNKADSSYKKAKKAYKNSKK